MTAPVADVSPKTPAIRPLLPKRIKLFYGLGAVANGAYGAMGGLAMFFYNQIVGVPAATVALAISLVIFIDGFWDPLIGHASDQTHSRLGRRHPFLIAALLMLPVAIYFRWHPPEGWQPEHMFWYILGTGLFINLAWSFYEVPSGAMTPELAPDYHDRTVVLSYRFMLGTMGSGLATILIYGIYLRATPDNPVGQLNPAGYGPLSLAVTAIVVLFGATMAFGTWRRMVKSKQTAPAAGIGVVEQLRAAASTLSNRNFLVALTSGMVAGLSTGINGGLGLYFQTFLWELRASDILILTLLGIPIPILAGLIAPRVSRLWGKKHATMGLFFASVAIGQIPMLLKLLGILNLNGSPWLLVVLATFSLLSGICSIGGFIIVSSMIADIVEEVQVKTGRRAEGLLATADSLPNKIVNAAAALIPGLMLVFVGFPRQARPGAEAMELITRVAWVYLPVISLIYLVSISIWSFYSLDKDAHERNLDLVDGRNG